MDSLRKQHISRRLGQVRQLANELSLRKMEKLDYGDIFLAAHMLDRIYSDLHRLRLIADSGCSQLLELLEYQGCDLSPKE